MATEDASEKATLADIIAEAKRFLTALDSGATDEQLAFILAGMQEKERQLLRAGGPMLDPEIWRILHSRMASRGGQEIIDTTL